MRKILVIYYSRSGNTEKMAKAVAEGAKSDKNLTVDLSYHVEADELSNYDAIIVGTPTYHTQMPIDFKNLFEEVSAKQINLKNKIGSAFGSYGWSGEAPQAVIEILKKLEMQVIEPPIRAKYNPDQKTLDVCIDLGKRVAQKLS
ncbi:MAG TPA: flavodoxin domain-containing protein [Candidatus Acidoferrum sp.]|nr:flavodoxin domain-containing protein [Candidatus Acidoferrum sp.]